MVAAVILLIVEVIAIEVNLRLFKSDILSPATVSSITFFIATLFALFCINVWELEIHWMTICVISLGLLMMTVGEFFGRRVRLHPYSRLHIVKKQDKKTNGLNRIFVQEIVKYMITFLIVAFTILYGWNAFHVGVSNGGTGLNAFAYMKAAYIGSGGKARMNVFIRQGYKVVMSGSYISCFILANNFLVLKEKLKENWEYILIILCGFMITIFSGARTEILRIVSALIFDFAFLWRLNKNKGKQGNRQSIKIIIKKAIPLAIIVAIIAFVSRKIVKTSNVATSATNSIFYYVAYYVGSSISVLNTKIKMAFINGGLLFGTNETIPEFVYLGKLDYGGNVGTILQTSLIKHGLIYMIFWILLIYIVGGFFYRNVLNSHKLSRKECLKIILFTSWYYVFTMSYYSDILSSASFIKTNILTNIVLIALHYGIFKIRIKSI